MTRKAKVCPVLIWVNDTYATDNNVLLREKRTSLGSPQVMNKKRYQAINSVKLSLSDITHARLSISVRDIRTLYAIEADLS
ncbi:hypothetical protein [Paenibacillus sp. GCM10028914]|uniref:hypothetical protein n=1 Tax=Paenibacillus sp. GCM10028914 TaxID=3273416 RepID=UPI003617C46E